MGELLDDYIAKYGDPLGGDAPKDVSVAQDSGLSEDLQKRIGLRVLEGRWKKQTGRDFTNGERSFIENEGKGNLGPEDLRQHGDLLEFLGAHKEDIQKALEETGNYKLEKTDESAKEWGVPKMVKEELSRAGGIVAKPFKELFTGHPLNALKEAVLIPAETITGIGDERDLLDTQRGVLKEGAGRLLGAGQEGVIGGALDASPVTAGKAFWKQLTEGGNEQSKRWEDTAKSLGIPKWVAKTTTFFADPLNLPTGGLAGKLASKLGLVGKVSKLGVESKVADAVGEALATTIGTQEEKWAAQLGKQKGSEVFDILTEKAVKSAMGKEQLAVDVSKAFTKPEVFDFMKKLPFVGESGAKAISNTLRSIPVLGKRFGVAAEEHPLVSKAIEGIKGFDAQGAPIFGTETRNGSGVWRVEPGEAADTFGKLSPSGKRAALWFASEREIKKAALGITSDIEGYLPHVWEEGLFGAGSGKFALTTQKAKGLMERAVQEGTGYIENPEKAILSRYGEIIGKEAHNDAVREIAQHVGQPIPPGGVPEGFVEVPKLKATRSGKPIGQLAGGKMMRKDLYDEIVRYSEAAKNVGGVKGALQNLGNFFKSNLLLAPGTAVTNAVGGGAQYAGRIVENMVKAMTGGGVKPLVNDVTNLLAALHPANVEKIRPELWAGKSAIFSEVGKSANPLSKLIRAGLAPFGMVENYFKRVIAMSELGAKGLKGLTKEQIAAQRGLLGELNKSIDTYAFNYDNVPNVLKKMRESPYGWMVMPFPTYGYKLARYYSRYGAALNPFVLMEPADRLARMLTLATLGGAGYAAAPGSDRKHIEGMTSQVDTTARMLAVKTPEGKEEWVRTVKYPWLNLGHALKAGVDLFGTGDDEGLQNVAGEFITEGPLVEGVKVAANIGNRWETFIPRGVRAANVVTGLIPGMRLTQGVKAMQGDERVLPETFTDSIVNSIPFTGMRGKVQMDRVTKKPVMLDPNIEAMKFWLGLNMKEIDPKRYTMERQKKLKAALTAISDAKNENDLNKAVDKLENVDPDKLQAIAEQIRHRRLRLEGQDFDMMNAVMHKESAAARKVQEDAVQGMRP